MGAGSSCPPGARGLLALLLLLLPPLPGARGDCGTPPTRENAIPLDTRTGGFPVESIVQYKCINDLVKIPGKSDTAICLPNSEWRVNGVFCGRSCGVPPRFRSAALRKEDEMKSYYPPGTTVTYVCRPGYEPTELMPIATCLENVKWSESPELCKKKSCPVPEGPKNGRVLDATDHLFGTKVNIICNDGFKLRGRTFIQCVLNGNLHWTQLPTCEAIPCLPPSNIAHGSHSHLGEEQFAFGSTVTYSCDKGFSLIGEASIRCTTKDQVNGEWSGPAPECKGKSCRPLELANGRVVFTDLLFGATVSFSCDDGYRMIGPASVQCVLSGNGVDWDKEVPHCEAIPCLPPSNIAHGSHSHLGEEQFAFGSTVTYSCDKGFSLIGEASIRCTTKDQVNGEWSGPAPECKGKSCRPLELANGRVVFTDLLFGATVSFSCDDGYRMIGPASVQCVLSGNGVDWDKEVPHCEAIPCLPPSNIAHGSHSHLGEEQFAFGSTVTYSCDKGFSLIGEASIRCTTNDQVNGEWSGPAPECKGDCGSPPRFVFAELAEQARDSYASGTKLKYSCRSGYVLSSGKSSLVTCVADSTWSSDPDFCEGKRCTQLELENGRVEITDLRFGATVSFSCDDGYRMIGPASVQCVLSGNGVDWDKEVPHCEAIACLPPPNIAHGSHSHLGEEQFAFGSTVTYSCDKGFSLIGEASIHCTTKDRVNGEWSGLAPECKGSPSDTAVNSPATEGKSARKCKEENAEKTKNHKRRSIQHLFKQGQVDLSRQQPDCEGSASDTAANSPLSEGEDIKKPINITLIVIGAIIAIASLASLAAFARKHPGKIWQKKKSSYTVSQDPSVCQMSGEQTQKMLI